MINRILVCFLLFGLSFSAFAQNAKALKYYERAVKKLEDGHPESAVDLAAKAVELDSEHMASFNLLGIAYYELGQYDRSLWYYSMAMLLSPAYLEIYYNRALVFEKLGRLEEAVEDLNKATDINRRYYEAYIARSRIRKLQGDHSAALNDLKYAIEIQPGNYLAYALMGQILVKESAMEDAAPFIAKAQQYGNQKAETYLLRAVILMKDKDYSAAVKMLDLAIEQDNNFSEAYNLRGVLKGFYLNLHRSAIADCNRVIDLRPHGPEGYCNRGLCYAGMGKHKRAIEDFTEAVHLAPKEAAYAYSNRGESYRNLGQYAEARADLELAIAMDPQNAYAFRNLGLILMESGSIEEACIQFSKAQKLGFEQWNCMSYWSWRSHC